MQDKETIESIWAGIEGDDELLEGTLMAPSEIAERQRFSKRFDRGAQAKVLSQDELVELTIAAWEKEQAEAESKTIHFPSGRTLLAIAATILVVFGITSAVVQYQHPVNWLTPQIALWGNVKGTDRGPDSTLTDQSQYTAREAKQVVRDFQLATQKKIDRTRDGRWKDHRVDFHINELADGVVRITLKVDRHKVEQDFESLQAFRDNIDGLSSQLANILMEPETEP